MHKVKKTTKMRKIMVHKDIAIRHHHHIRIKTIIKITGIKAQIILTTKIITITINGKIIINGRTLNGKGLNGKIANIIIRIHTRPTIILDSSTSKHRGKE